MSPSEGNFMQLLRLLRRGLQASVELHAIGVEKSLAIVNKQEKADGHRKKMAAAQDRPRSGR